MKLRQVSPETGLGIYQNEPEMNADGR